MINERSGREKYAALQAAGGWKATITREDIKVLLRNLQKVRVTYAVFDRIIERIDGIKNSSMRNEPFLMTLISHDSNDGADRAARVVLGDYAQFLPRTHDARNWVTPLIKEKVREYYQGQQVLDISKSLIQKYGISGFDSDSEVRKLISCIGVREGNYKIFKANQDLIVNMIKTSSITKYDVLKKLDARSVSVTVHQIVLEIIEMIETRFDNGFVYHAGCVSVFMYTDRLKEYVKDLVQQVYNFLLHIPIRNIDDPYLYFSSLITELSNGDEYVDCLAVNRLKKAINFKNPSDAVFFTGNERFIEEPTPCLVPIWYVRDCDAEELAGAKACFEAKWLLSDTDAPVKAVASVASRKLKELRAALEQSSLREIVKKEVASIKTEGELNFFRYYLTELNLHEGGEKFALPEEF